MTPSPKEMSELMSMISKGDRSAVSRLMSILYDDLRSMAARFLSRESSHHTFQPTDLVNESFLKLVDQTSVSWQGKTHFMAVSAQAMRRILVDHARTKHRKKRGGSDRIRLQLRDDQAITLECPDEILSVDEALEKLEKLDPLHARILEYRFFGGMGMKEIAETLRVSSRTVERHWAMVRAWFLRELQTGVPEKPAAEVGTLEKSEEPLSEHQEIPEVGSDSA
jgi:RNA polymerase sigma factor (TIGR02999 family)